MSRGKVVLSKGFDLHWMLGGAEIFELDWTGDGKADFIDDLITLDLLGLLDEEDESDEEDEDDE